MEGLPMVKENNFEYFSLEGVPFAASKEPRKVFRIFDNGSMREISDLERALKVLLNGLRISKEEAISLASSMF